MCISSPHAFVLQYRLAVYMIYGVLSAGWLLGVFGVVLLMLHLSISLAVAQLRNPTVSWCCSLLLLSTLNMSAVQDLQVRKYACEFSNAVTHVCEVPNSALFQGLSESSAEVRRENRDETETNLH